MVFRHIFSADTTAMDTSETESFIAASDVIAPLGGLLSSDDGLDFRLHALQIIE